MSILELIMGLEIFLTESQKGTFSFKMTQILPIMGRFSASFVTLMGSLGNSNFSLGTGQKILDWGPSLK